MTAPPPGYILDEPVGDVHDGDTFQLGSGGNARLFGVDAFELGQPGYIGSDRVDLGDRGRSALSGRVASGRNVIMSTGAETYGRPVVMLSNDGDDVGADLVRTGDAVPVLKYLASDPKRSADYLATQRDAIAGERGAYAGKYQLPSDYRHEGEAAAWRGKIKMTPQQLQEYAALVRDPKTTAADLQSWAGGYGHHVANADNILSFIRQNPQAEIGDYFQQDDAADKPVLADGPNVVTRGMGAFNEGLADLAGAPVDLANAAMGLVGLPVSRQPFLGSEWLRDKAHDVGLGQTSIDYAPRSALERYGQAASRGVGQSALPLAGTVALGGRLALSGAASGGATRQALRGILTEAAARPGLAAALEVGGGAGSGIGAQVADDVAPGNPYASMAGQLAGGFLGGVPAVLGSGRAARSALSAAEEAAPTFRLDPAAVAPAPAVVNPDVIRFKDAGDLGNFRSRVHPDKAAMSDAEFLDWFGKSRDIPSVAVVGEASPAAKITDAVDPLSAVQPDSGSSSPDGSSPPARARAPVSANSPPVDDASNLGPRSVLNLAPRDGVPGISVTNDEGHVATAIFRDEQGVPRGTVQIPLTPEARDIYEPTNAYVDPSYRRQGVATQLYDALKREGYAIDDLSGSGDLTPDGAAFVNSRRANMDQEGMSPASISAVVAPPPGYVLDEPVGRPTPLLDRASPEQVADIARGTEPDSVLPLPNNEIGSLDEAMRANPGPRELVAAPNERDALPTYRLGSGPPRKDPLDLIGFLRTRGGIRPQGGELEHMGITNKARDIEFAKAEGFLGKLVNPEGMPYDEAARAAWEEGYFPDFNERPTPSEFLDALNATHRGGAGRVFHPDDYEALDAYRSAQRDRNAVEEAEQSGAPLARDVGEPVDMADLDKNQPPATAYEDLPSIGGKVGNIRVDKLGSSLDISRALQTVDNRFGGFDAARRGKIAQAETQALAAELNMTPGDLLKRRQGQALNAEQALAARAILAKSGDELVKLAKAAVGGSDEAKAAFQAGLVRHAAIQEQVAGATAEAGRALAQFRMDAPGALARGRMLKAVIDSGGGSDKLEDVAKRILDLEKDPAAANKFARDVMKPGAWAMAKEYWINALLSGPRTHATNIGSNLLTALWSLPEHAATATIGKITGSADKMLYRDVGARAVGMMEGARDGLRLARKAFMTGEPTDGVSQVEAQQYRAIPGKVGSVIRTPTRALMAEDEFFKSIAYRGELNAIAAREAYGKPGTAAERRKVYEELRDNPTDAMIDRAVKAAQYQTFQQPLKGPGVQIQMIANKGPMKLFLPFVRTPLNLLKYAAERSPVAPVLGEFRDAVKAGGIARDQAMARVTMGSGLSALAVSWALDGKLSGSGPPDPRERQLLRDSGWQPFSVKVGNKWYSYQRIDPFARVLSTAADFATLGEYMTDKERDDVASAMAMAVARNISTMPTLDPAASAFEALSDPDRYLIRYLKNLGSSAAVPNVVTQINSTLDPYMRETDTLMDTIKSRVPGLSSKLTPRLNVWGEPVERGDALGPDVLSPIWTSEERNDPVAKALLDIHAKISAPDKKIGGVELDAATYAKYKALAGRYAKEDLGEAVGSDEWKQLTVEERLERVADVMRDARRDARDELGLSEKTPAPAAPPAGFVLDQ